MAKTQAVGIDLGTTYSCIAYLNEHGQPETITNQEGELSTPSVVFFDEDSPVVGTEALRNAIARPECVVQNVKRFMGHTAKTWQIGKKRYTPVYVSSLILKKLLAAAKEKLGEITDAVITVPAQFSDAQRHATIKAGISAGLKKVDIINEPVAAALCHVLDQEGLAFTELAPEQQLMVYDLGGGTLDLAIVSYKPNEVRVVASDGDLELGGLDWTQIIVDMAAERFISDFKSDPRVDPESHQFLALEAEQAKRSLSVRPKAAVTVQHEGQRRTYQIAKAEFEELAIELMRRSDTITRRILADSGFGWAHVDVLLTTGGSSRMPMVRDGLQQLSGRTLNQSLSPDQSIAHGAAYYAGMLLSNQAYAQTTFGGEASSRLKNIKQQSVSARALGILIRDEKSGKRVPHYLIPPNSPLPTSRTSLFGTVVNHQTRVHVKIVESGAGPGRPHTILGDCIITDLPTELQEGSEVEVTISYDPQARVHVSAQELKSGKRAEVEFVRQENISAQLPDASSDTKAEITEPAQPTQEEEPPTAEVPDVVVHDKLIPDALTADEELRSEWELVSAQLAEFADFGTEESDFSFEPAVDTSEQPVPLCNNCGKPLRSGKCAACGPASQKKKKSKRRKKRRPQ